MLRQIAAGLAQGTRLFMMTYHSSSLLPGAGPYVRDEEDCARFVNAIEGTIARFREMGGQVASLGAVAASLVPA